MAYNSFAGSDIKAIIGQFQFAELQAISYAITREKAPIYTMGSPDPRAYSRNKRGIAGNLIWLNFDRHALLQLLRKPGAGTAHTWGVTHSLALRSRSERAVRFVHRGEGRAVHR
jgi:hypothetical protein